jgi:hypothetical protein
MSRRHIPCKQKLYMVPLQSNNPVIKTARDFRCSDRTIRRVNHLGRSIGNIVRQSALCRRQRKLYGVHVVFSSLY